MKQVYVLKEPVDKITLPGDLFKNIKNIDVDYEQENLILFCLNTKKQIVHSETVFKGGLNTCCIDPKTIFRIALKYNSDSVIIAHNHPSGDLQPSTEDKHIFEMLKNAGEVIEVRCLDSIIFNKKEFYSLWEA